MVSELKKKVDSGKVLLGVRQTLKHAGKIDKAILPNDCREEIKQMLNNKKIEMEILNMPKDELATKLELDFACEVFGVLKK